MKLADMMTLLLIVAIVIAASIIGAGQAGKLRGHRPADIGPRDGMLKRPEPGARNAVSSQSHDNATFIAPLALTGDPDAAFTRLQMILSGMPRATIVTSQPGYLHVEFQTGLLKFVDDVEFLLDAKRGRIDMRSASRLGQRDFGVNRARLEQIREAFDARQAGADRPMV